MSRRTDKKRLKKINEVQAAKAVSASETAPAAEVQAQPAEAAKPSADYTMFLQFMGTEYETAALAARIKEKCSAEGLDASDLKIYVKPEDRKAYYVCAGGSGCIEL